MFKRKWKQVCLCQCGYITEVNGKEFQTCGGCKYHLSNSAVNKLFLYGRKNSDGTWELKE